MTQNEKDLKELLLKDLCARLPYGVKASYYGAEEECECVDVIDAIYRVVEDRYEVAIGQYDLPIEKVKPYLFPFSSIYDNEELRKEFDGLIELELKTINDEITHVQATEFEVDFYNKHHLDWRGLIPMGLANDATGLNIY